MGLKMAKLKLKRLEARVVEEFSTNKWIQAKALFSGGVSIAQMFRAGFSLATTESCWSFPPSWKCAPDVAIFGGNLVLASMSRGLWVKASKNVQHAKEVHEKLAAAAQDLQSMYCSSKSEDQRQCLVKQTSELPDWWKLLADVSDKIMPNFLA